MTYWVEVVCDVPSEHRASDLASADTENAYLNNCWSDLGDNPNATDKSVKQARREAAAEARQCGWTYDFKFMVWTCPACQKTGWHP